MNHADSRMSTAADDSALTAEQLDIELEAALMDPALTAAQLPQHSSPLDQAHTLRSLMRQNRLDHPPSLPSLPDLIEDDPTLSTLDRSLFQALSSTRNLAHSNISNPEPDLPSPTLIRADALQPPVPATRSAKIIAITSGKGGVGKTNIAVNLAVALSQLGLRIVLLDADLGTANADLLCGISPTARLDHVLTPLPIHDAGKRTLRDIAVSAPGGFHLIPGSAGVARIADLDPARQHELIRSLDQLLSDIDILLIDTAAGIGRSVMNFLLCADQSLLVTTPEPTALADAYALLKCLRTMSPRTDATPMGLIVNQCADAQEARSVYLRLAAVAERFLTRHVEYIGHIAQDMRVAQGVRARLPFVLHAPNARATRDIRSIAAALAQGVVDDHAHARYKPSARPSLLSRWLGLNSVGKARKSKS